MAEQRVVGCLPSPCDLSTHRHLPTFMAHEIAEQAYINGYNLAKTVMMHLDF